MLLSSSFGTLLVGLVTLLVSHHFIVSKLMGKVWNILLSVTHLFSGYSKDLTGSETMKLHRICFMKNLL